MQKPQTELNNAIWDLHKVEGLTAAIDELIWQEGTDQFPRLNEVLSCARAAKDIASKVLHDLENLEKKGAAA